MGKIPSKETRKKMSLARKGKPFTEQHKNNMRKAFKKGAEHHLWKGSAVGYSTLHRWVQAQRGTASKCEWCGSTSKMEWANISREYRRELDDWMQLCHSCHMKYDKIPEKVWATRKSRYGHTGAKPKLAT